MKKNMLVFLIFLFLMSLSAESLYAKSSKTWSNVGKGLAIYEGVKVVTGSQGNILDDVTGGMQPRKAASSGQSGTFQDGYNSGYQSGYDAGYNAGFRKGAESSR
jgi:hypothetical protein